MQSLKYRYCRICLSKENLNDIFTRRSVSEKSLAEKIACCTSIQISPKDSLPLKICRKCESYLNVAYTFKAVCEWIDSKLRKEDFDRSVGADIVELHEKLLVRHGTVKEYKNLIENLLYEEDNLISLYDDNLQENKILYNSNNDDSDSDNLNFLTNQTNFVPDEIIGDFANDDISIISEEIVTSSPEVEGFHITGEKQEFGAHTVISEDFIEQVENTELSIGMAEVTLNFNYDYHHTLNDSKAAYRRVSLNSEDPLLMNVADEHNALKKGLKESKANLNNILLDDFENFERQIQSENECHRPRTKTKNFNNNDKTENNRVGRHIAKKNAGQPPKRYSPALESMKTLMNHEMTENNKTKYEKVEEELEKKNALKQIEVSDVLHNEYILEDDLSLPEPIFEETIITESFYYMNDTNDYEEENFIKNHQNRQFKNKNKKEVQRKVKIGRKDHNKLKVNCGRKKITKCEKAVINLSANKRKNNQQKSAKVNTTCKMCNKSFPFPSHLQRHLTAHIGIKHFTCKYCNKQFLHRYNLSVHMRSHTGNFPLHCDICNRGFASPSVLERHKRSHTGETPYQCHICFQLFSHASSLTMHEKMHLNRPSFTCEVCFRVFSYKSSLTAHKKGHSGLKPHTCSVCHKTFTRNTSVIRHMLCHTEAKTFKCKKCDQVFNSKNNLVKHSKLHFRTF